MATVHEIMTPEDVAEYLQLDRETVYRYIREGKLAASKLGRSYRVKKTAVDLLLLATSTSPMARDALFDRVERAGERNRDVSFEEVERDVAAAIAEVRQAAR